jgi:hypothetical protein
MCWNNYDGECYDTLAALLDMVTRSFRRKLTIIAVKMVVTGMEMLCEMILRELMSQSSRM